ncbi:GDSL-type esterase/lipase family protein [Paenibacillus xylanilyticus]|uniref:GDSL-type esterase/lipase family protein n=1 Tax=Paenibacillus xylanilyticus TaxID=248903 RepID=UPI00129E76A1|nr:GDSL-type esterase/lipase family protein [Paenibacillus xylanilyticus]
MAHDSRARYSARKVLEQVKQAEKQSGYLYNGDEGLTRWRSDLAKVQNGDKIANLVIIGSSSVVGQGGGGGGVDGSVAIDKQLGWFNGGFVGRFRSKLAKEFGNVGRGFIPHTHPDFFVNKTGTWNNLATHGFLGVPAIKSSGDASLSIKFSGTSLTLITVLGTLGAGFTVAVDQGAPKSFTSIGSASPAAELVVATGLTDAEHTAVLTVTDRPQAASGVTLIGMYEGRASAGVRVNGMGLRGSRTSSALSGENFMQTQIDIWKPALTVIAYGSNDYAAQVPLDTFKNQTQTLIDRAKQYGDVILYSAGFRSSELAIPLDAYVQVYRELAEQNNLAFYETYKRWRTFDYAKSVLQFVASDDVHMNDYGHQDLANALYNAIIHN